MFTTFYQSSCIWTCTSYRYLKDSLSKRVVWHLLQQSKSASSVTEVPGFKPQDVIEEKVIKETLEYFSAFSFYHGNDITLILYITLKRIGLIFFIIPVWLLNIVLIALYSIYGGLYIELIGSSTINQVRLCMKCNVAWALYFSFVSISNTRFETNISA